MKPIELYKRYIAGSEASRLVNEIWQQTKAKQIDL